MRTSIRSTMLKFWKLNHSNNFPSPKTTMFTKMKYNSCLANIPFFDSSFDASESNIRIGTEHTAETANICQSIFTLICASNPPKTEIKTVAAINTPNVTLPKISINIFKPIYIHTLPLCILFIKQLC